MTRPRALAAALAALLAGACSSFGEDELPTEAPRLADMEEPLPLHEEPKDEAARLALPAGTFTGVVVTDARTSLESQDGDEAGGVRVQKVIENSPGDAAGIAEDDLLLEARVDGGAPRPLRWPSEWRAVELEATPGGMVSVLLDRAGVELRADLEPVARVRPAERGDVQRFREEERVGVVLRTATEVEARAAGLAPGGGAVVVGLSRGSPWRAAGLRFGDVVAAADGEPVAHPQALLEAIRAAPEDGRLALEVVRGASRVALEAPLTQREHELNEVHVPLLYSYESERGLSETSVLLGLFRARSTAVAWEWRLLWLFTIRGGDADRLAEVDE